MGCPVCLLQFRRGLSRPSEAVKFGSHGGVASAAPIRWKIFPGLPQGLGLRIGGVADGPGAAAKFGQRAGLIPGAVDLASQVEGLP